MNKEASVQRTVTHTHTQNTSPSVTTSLRMQGNGKWMHLVNMDQFNLKMYKFVHASFECICIPYRKFKEYFYCKIDSNILNKYIYI